ncbi:MAG: phage tail assembly protein, partial [Shimia sp.]
MPTSPPTTVELSEAITIDGKSVTTLTLRSPKAGELRGVK